MRLFALLIGIFLSGAVFAATEQVPADLAAISAKARLEGPVAKWCRSEFRPGHPGAFAVAVPSNTGGGRYLVVETNGRTFPLASYSGRPDLSCYSPAEARKLSDTIRRSETIQGNIEPLWGTTVICGFVENTHAVCWQHSPTENAFVKVGDWVT
jgi:hypothetical protein